MRKREILESIPAFIPVPDSTLKTRFFQKHRDRLNPIAVKLSDHFPLATLA